MITSDNNNIIIVETTSLPVLSFPGSGNRPQIPVLCPAVVRQLTVTKFADGSDAVRSDHLEALAIAVVRRALCGANRVSNFGVI